MAKFGEPFSLLMENPMLYFVKLNPNAKLPSYGSDGAIGLDLYAASPARVPPHWHALIGTGLAVAAPPGHYGRIADRSSVAAHGLHVVAGVIDPDYRGEIKVLLFNLTPTPKDIRPGDRIAQLIIECAVRLEPVWVAKLDPTVRAEGGFGSTGR